jgi:hypothetical protein
MSDLQGKFVAFKSWPPLDGEARDGPNVITVARGARDEKDIYIYLRCWIQI